MTPAQSIRQALILRAGGVTVSCYGPRPAEWDDLGRDVADYVYQFPLPRHM